MTLPSDPSPFDAPPFDAAVPMPPPMGAPTDAQLVAPTAASNEGWRRRHPSSPVINTIDSGYRTVRLAWPAAIALALRGPAVFIGVTAVIAAALGLWMTISHLRFQYRLTGAGLEVRSGVFTHHTRTLPVDRVQQVSLDQKLRHQVFGVVDVGIESAGGGDVAEIQLSVLTTADAEVMRERLTVARRQVGAEVPAGELPPPIVSVEPTLLYSQSTRALLRWSLATSPLLMLIVVAPVFTTAGGFIRDQLSDRFPTGVVGVSLALALVALVALAAATIINVVRYHDLRLMQAGDEIRLRYGLLTQHQVDVPRERIQVLVETLTLPARLAGVVGVTAHNASGTSGGTSTYLPAVERGERGEVTGLLVPGVDLDATLRRHPRAALVRAIVRRVVPVLLVAVAVLAATRSAWALLAFVLVPVSIAFGWRSWVVLGHGETPDAVVGRAGVWGESTSYVRRDRVQSASVGASWTQRRRGLATLRIDVAQPLGKVVIDDMAAADARRILADLTAARR